MIRLILKLVLAALIANAVWRTGSVYAQYYKFKDAVQETTQYAPDQSDDELRARIIELASQYDLPIDEGDFTVRRSGNHTITDGAFTRPVELLPNYQYPWPFSWHTDTFKMSGAVPPPR